MSIELQLLKLFSKDKDAHDRYGGKILDLSLEKEIKDVLNLIGKYYSAYPEHTFISEDELLAYCDHQYSGSKVKPIYQELIKRAYTLDTSDSLATDVIKAMLEKDTGNKIVQELLPLLSGEACNVLEKVKEHIQVFELDVEEQKEASSLFVEDDLEDLIAQCTTDGIAWRLKCLNDDLKQLPGNTLGHFFAVPDAGKTSFVHSEVSFFEGQLKGDETILWANNEEGGSKVRLRHYSAVCNATRDQIMDNPQKAKEMFAARGGHRLKLYDKAVITTTEIERIAIEYKSRIAIVDIGDKIQYAGRKNAGNGADALQGVYDNLREVVKRVNRHHKFDMITTGQAGVTAENKKWLQQSDLYGGKTGKAGAFDYIIGMGHLIENPALRYFTCCKNKLGDQSGRHVVNFDPLRARFSD